MAVNKKLSALTENTTPALTNFLYGIEATPTSGKYKLSKILDTMVDTTANRLIMGAGAGTKLTLLPAFTANKIVVGGSPLTTIADPTVSQLVIGGTPLASIAAGTAGQYLQMVGGVPAYTDPAGTLILTNKTGGSLVNGDVVTFDTANDSAVALDDTQWSTRPFLVCLESIANNSSGRFLFQGRTTTVNVTGTITRGDYVRKSATSKKVEDLGLSHAIAGRGRPYGALGIALTADAAGVATIYWFGIPPVSGVMAAQLSESTTASGAQVDLVTFSNLNIPATANWTIYGLQRKTAGAAAAATVGMKVNAVQIFANFASTTATNQAEMGHFGYNEAGFTGGGRATNYTQSGLMFARSALLGAAMGSFSSTTFAAQLPTAAITAIIVTANSGSAAQTMGLTNIILYIHGN